MSNKDTTITTPSVLAFERKLDPSAGYFYAGNWSDRANADQWAAIGIDTKSVRGTISNRMKGSAPDPAKFNADIQKPNLQTVDNAALPANCDTLKLRFTLRVLGQLGKPNACNSLAYQEKLAEALSGYADSQGYRELARRYAINLANGRCLWRNRPSAETVEVQIRHLKDGNEAHRWTFDALELSLRDFEVPALYAAAVQELQDVLADALSGDGYTLLEITAFARMGAGQEVYPSQELILDSKEKKSKTLYKVEETAAMHSQKIGNALRTIDTWYPGEDHVGPIAVEPYGSVTPLGKAFRQPKEKQDFYHLLDSWMTKDQVPALEQQHFVVAVLVRGGVFGAAEKN